MLGMKIIPDKMSYSASINVCAKEGHWLVAASLLSQMTKEKLEIDQICFNSVIHACEKGGQWRYALGYLCRMPGTRAMQDEISYNAAISACEKGLEWQLAVCLLGSMCGRFGLCKGRSREANALAAKDDVGGGQDRGRAGLAILPTHGCAGSDARSRAQLEVNWQGSSAL
ncbi:unnamed protein product [Polarella glacialis]|uniref:Pentatricopeptide repeat-containing protein n=1 Tax=Polarella glacialis TaxID=89957 RepID=A0A813HDN0_POLGL|nr:unnamed protein product [Polarella glacialis]